MTLLSEANLNMTAESLAGGLSYEQLIMHALTDLL